MHDTTTPLARWLVAAVLLGALALAFAPTLHAPFLLDDYFRIVANTGVATFWPPWRHFVDPSTSSSASEYLVQYRPLLPLSLSIDVALWGARAMPMRLGNIVLHAGVVLLTFGFVRELLAHWSGATPLTRRSSDLLALTVAVIVAVHPVATTTVNYISARDLVMAQCFLLVVLWTYAHHRRQGSAPWSPAWLGRWALMLTAFALAMLAKQNVVVLPALLVVFDVLLGRTPLGDRALWLRPLPFIAIVGGWMLWSRAVLHFDDLENALASLTPAQHAFTQAKLHATEYAAALFWPFRLRYFPLVTTEHVLWNPRTIAGVCLIAGSLVLAWRLRRRWPLFAFGVGSYWTLMSLESSVLPVHNPMMPYRQYPSLLFVALALTVVARDCLGTRPRARRAVAVLAVSACLAVTLLRSAHWRSEYAFWTHAASYGADYRAHLNLAASIDDPRDARVAEHLTEATRQMMGLSTGSTAVGVRIDGVDDVVNRFVADPDAHTDSTVGRAHFWRAHALRDLGRRAEARVEADRAADAAPTVASYQWYAAMDAQHVQDWARVVELAERLDGLVDTSGRSSIAFLAGGALQQMGRIDEAIAWYRRYLDLPAGENSEEGRYQVTMNFAIAAAAVGRCGDARAYVAQRLIERPSDAVLAELSAACPP